MVFVVVVFLGRNCLGKLMEMLELIWQRMVEGCADEARVSIFGEEP